VRSAAEFKAANAEKSKYEEAVNIKSTTSYPSLSTPITPAVVQTKQVMNFKAALAKEETAPQQEPVKTHRRMYTHLLRHVKRTAKKKRRKRKSKRKQKCLFLYEGEVTRASGKSLSPCIESCLIHL
jgi:uncharacterized protein (DUF2336 family)